MVDPVPPAPPAPPAPPVAPPATTAAPAAPESSGGGFLSGLLNTVKNMFVNPTTGKMNTGAVLSTVVLGGLGAWLGSGSGLIGALLGGVGGAVGGAIGAPLISQLVSSIGQMLGISGPAQVPGGVPEIPGMAPGVARPPLVTQAAPVQSPTPGGTASNTVIRSPALENMVIPTATVSDAVTARTAAQRDAARLAVGTANADVVSARWRDVTRQEKSIADFVATMEEYGRQRETYMGPNGERSRLVSEIVARGGKTQAEAEAMVPSLPPLPEAYTANRRASDRIQEFRAQYEQDKERGNLPAEYGNKPWAELDPVMQAGYAYNKVNQQVAAIKSDININNLPPISRGGVGAVFDWTYGRSGNGNRYSVAGLDQPNFDRTDRWDWSPAGMKINCASVCIARLRDDPDAVVNGERVTTTLRRYAEHARNNGADEVTYAEMGKIVQYCDAVEQRSALLTDLNAMNAPVQSLEEFRRGPMEEARTQVNAFLASSLPQLNRDINRRREAAAGTTVTAPAPGTTVVPPATPAPVPGTGTAPPSM